MGRGDLTDDQWQQLKPLLPSQKPTTGRPSKDHRTVINGILWVLRTGAPWRDLPQRYGLWRTVASRFYRWRKQGLWGPTPGRGAAEGGCQWAGGMGSPLCRWHQHSSASARCWSKKGEGDQALGRSRGGFGTKVHVRVEGAGKPVAFVLTPGQQHEASVFEELMTRGAVRRPRGGRPRIRPRRVCGDKGYSSRKIRSYLRRERHPIHYPTEKQRTTQWPL